MTRGAPSLSGRVNAPAPAAPSIEWTYQAGAAITSEAAIADGLIVVGDDDGAIHAVDIATRKLRWRTVTGDTVEATPAIAGGKILTGSHDGTFRALDATNGTVLWSHEGDDKFPTGAILADDDSLALVNGYDGITRCWRIADGTEAWRHDTRDYINGSPALLDDGRIVFGGCDARLHILTLKDGTATTGFESEAHIVRSLAAGKTAVYGVNHANQVFAATVDATAPLWLHELPNTSPTTQPAADEERVYVACQDRTLRALNRNTGQPVWEFKAGGRVAGAPLVFDDLVVFGAGDGRLYGVEKVGGEERWRLDVGEALLAPVAFAGGRLVVGGADGTLFVVVGGGAVP